MNQIRIAAAVLLALPLIVFGGNYFARLFELPDFGAGSGQQLLQSIREGGLMAWIAGSHLLIGLLLLLPRTRVFAGLLQLPISIGIVAFHYTMLRDGLPLALGMLGLNLIVLAEPARFRSLLAPAAKG